MGWQNVNEGLLYKAGTLQMNCLKLIQIGIASAARSPNPSFLTAWGGKSCSAPLLLPPDEMTNHILHTMETDDSHDINPFQHHTQRHQH